MREVYHLQRAKQLKQIRKEQRKQNIIRLAEAIGASIVLYGWAVIMLSA